MWIRSISVCQEYSQKKSWTKALDMILHKKSSFPCNKVVRVVYDPQQISSWTKIERMVGLPWTAICLLSLFRFLFNYFLLLRSALCFHLMKIEESYGSYSEQFPNKCQTLGTIETPWDPSDCWQTFLCGATTEQLQEIFSGGWRINILYIIPKIPSDGGNLLLFLFVFFCRDPFCHRFPGSPVMFTPGLCF